MKRIKKFYEENQTAKRKNEKWMLKAKSREFNNMEKNKFKRSLKPLLVAFALESISTVSQTFLEDRNRKHLLCCSTTPNLTRFLCLLIWVFTVIKDGRNEFFFTFIHKKSIMCRGGYKPFLLSSKSENMKCKHHKREHKFHIVKWIIMGNLRQKARA